MIEGKGFGLDVGGSSIKWVVVSDGEVVDSGSEPTPQEGSREVCDALIRAVEAHATPAGVDGPVGFALPGSLDSRTSHIVNLPNIPGEWTGLRPTEYLESATGRRWHVLNDARAFAASQLVAGAARGVSDALLLALGTGVGGAVVLDHHIWMGGAGLVGEIGHVGIDPNGRKCGCGARGCLETYAGAAGILKEAGRRGLSDRLARRHPDTPVTAREVFAAATEGDEDARELTGAAGDALGTVIGRISTLLCPDRIVIGGGLAAGLTQLMPSIDAAIEREIRIIKPPPIVTADFGSLAGAVGAALWAAGAVPIAPARFAPDGPRSGVITGAR